MEELKKYLREHIIFDSHEDETGEAFDCVLQQELDRLTIYYSDCKEILNIEPETVIQLACTYQPVEKDDSLETIISRALSVLAYDYMYSELEDMYMNEYEEI